MREDHPADLVCELEAPRAEEGDKGGRVDDGRVVVLGMAEPEHLDARGDDEGQQEQEGPDGGLPGGAGRLAHVCVAGEDVEREAECAEDHEDLVEPKVGKFGEKGYVVESGDSEEFPVPE